MVENEDTLNVTETDGTNSGDNSIDNSLPSDSEDEPVTDTGSEEINSVINFSNNRVFKARVFLENDGSTYGAEVVIFSKETDEPIETILITDLSKFNEFAYNIDYIKSFYIPYTEQDKENMEVILNYLNETDETLKASMVSDYNLAKNNPSYYQEIGNLQSILENNILDSISNGALESHHRHKEVVINATYLNGKDSNSFSQVGHLHNNYLSHNHSNIIGDGYNWGHVKVIDNLTTRTNNGEVLSANQGYVLDNKIDTLKKSVTNNWREFKVNDRLSYRVNELLHLVVCDYNYPNCNKFKDKTGVHDLESKGKIKKKYCPTYRVNSPVYRSDINFMVNTDGSIKAHNLTKHDSWNIKVQVLWYYQQLKLEKNVRGVVIGILVFKI